MIDSHAPATGHQCLFWASPRTRTQQCTKPDPNSTKSIFQQKFSYKESKGWLSVSRASAPILSSMCYKERATTSSWLLIVADIAKDYLWPSEPTSWSNLCLAHPRPALRHWVRAKGNQIRKYLFLMQAISEQV